MSCFENWLWDCKRILQYLVSMGIFAFSAIILLFLVRKLFLMFSTVFYKIKNKTKEKSNYVKSVNTVKSIFNEYTISISLSIHLDFGKKIYNSNKSDQMSIANSVVSCLFAEFVCLPMLAIIEINFNNEFLKVFWTFTMKVASDLMWQSQIMISSRTSSQTRFYKFWHSWNLRNLKFPICTLLPTISLKVFTLHT